MQKITNKADVQIARDEDASLSDEVFSDDHAVHVDDLISRMKALRSGLRPAEQRVADVVLKDIESAVRASNSQLAQAANVSEPTVTRFCRALGCEGVRDFKLRLAQSLVAGSMTSSNRVEPDDSRLPYWSAVFSQARNAIRLAERQLDEVEVSRAIECVSKAGRVFVFGLGGGSTSLALDMQYRLFRFGISVTAYSDNYLMRMVVATVRPGDVVIMISATGRTQELIEAVAIAKNYDAKVVAITRPKSNLAAAADIALTVEVPEIVNVLKPTASRFAFLAVIDLVATGVAYQLEPEGQETWRRVKLNLMSMREGDVLEPLGD